MIETFIIFNNVGKARLIKFYKDTSCKMNYHNFMNIFIRLDEKRHSLIKNIFPLVQKLDDKSCNFFSDTGLVNSKSKIVVRQYATLFFVMIVDDDESELAILDLIQIIVEALDNIFENACELDLIYHPDKVNSLIDQIIIGGTVIETNLLEIVETMKNLANYEKKKGYV